VEEELATNLAQRIFRASRAFFGPYAVSGGGLLKEKKKKKKKRKVALI
jgi:hypothetical protein